MPQESAHLEMLRTGKLVPEPLCYDDLLLLLASDRQLKKALQQCLALEEIEDNSVTSPPTVDLRQQLLEPLQVLERINNNTHLREFWNLDTSQNEGERLLKWLMQIAKWSNIKDLWLHLQEYCKQQQLAISADERVIIEQCLHLHNAAYEGNQVSLVDCQIGMEYDYEQHNALVAQGTVIVEQLLPGLQNLNLDRVQKPLVRT